MARVTPAVGRFRARPPIDEVLERGAAIFSGDAEQAVRVLLAGRAMPEINGLVELFADDARDAIGAGVGGWADASRPRRGLGLEVDHPHTPTTLVYREDDELRTRHGAPLATALGVPITTHPDGHLAFFDQWADALHVIAGNLR